MWIQRQISEQILKNRDFIQIVKGPRQCGKSSLLVRLDQDFKEVSLDDPSLRQLAQEDPTLFLKQFEGQKILIDEAQYAPALFPSLKRKIDLQKRKENYKRETLVRITGSNQILMDRLVKESLAGRASFFEMNTLSVAEILGSVDLPIQRILYQGGWPEIYAIEGVDSKKFLDDYLISYVEKDVVLASGIQKSREFLRLVKLLAGRVGQLIDLASFARDASVDPNTIKEWLSILERMQVLALVAPYSSNLSKRLTKAPKIYFLDTGLACRLQGWTSAEPILTSPQQGHLFENLVFSEIYKTSQNYQLGWQIYHWRSRDGEEVDFLIERGPGDFVFVEAKVSPQKSADFSKYPEIKKVFGKQKFENFVCHQEGEQVLAQRVPIARLAEVLRRH